MDKAPTEPPRSQTTCPTCGAPAEPGQLVCLECGSRITLSYRRPPSWKIPVAISAVLLLLAGAGSVLAYQAIDDEAEREVAATPLKVSDRAGAAEEAASRNTDQAEPDPDAATGSLLKDGPLYTWPLDLEGFTVVLQSNDDRESADDFAASASESGSEKIGVIRSNDFETLPQGFFIVFAGQYPDREKADAAAARLDGRFPGAFTQAVRR